MAVVVGSTSVVNVRAGEAFDVYVGRGRGSRWGNPFKVGVHGDRAECVALFARWLHTSDDVRARWMRRNVGALRGKRLACWCAPEACHAEVLAELAERVG